MIMLKSDETIINGLKVRWTIGEIAELCDVNVATIRNWEEYFNIKGKRDRNNRRHYNKENRLVFKIISIADKSGNYTLKGIRDVYLPKFYEMYKKLEQ